MTGEPYTQDVRSAIGTLEEYAIPQTWPCIIEAANHEKEIREAVEKAEHDCKQVVDWKRRENIRKQAAGELPTKARKWYFRVIWIEEHGAAEKERQEREMAAIKETESFKKMEAEEEKERIKYMATEAFIKRKEEINEEASIAALERKNAEVEKHIDKFKKTEAYKQMEREVMEEFRKNLEAPKTTEGDKLADGDETAELQQPELKPKEKEASTVADEKNNK